MITRFSTSFSLLILMLAGSAADAQSPNVVCVTSATPPIVASEGVTVRVGDIVYACTGQPNTPVTANLTIALNVNITNRLSSGNTLTGIVFTIDTGAGPQAVPIQPVLVSPGLLTYNGVKFTLPANGTATLRFADIRGNATQVGPYTPIIASLATNNTAMLLSGAYLNVGTPQRSLFSSQSSRIVCSPNGSKLPDTITFSSLINSGAIFASTRVTEGFADALQPRAGWANLNADSGDRIVVRYGNFPQGARLFVPDVVAGSDAVSPTAGGDFGLTASGGAYAPSVSGSLLLARVIGADANGVGGGVAYFPAAAPPPGSLAPVKVDRFDSVSELQMVNGSAYAVYEVVDSDPSRFESAQFPTFLGLPPVSAANAVVTNENVYLAPISTVSTATTSDAIPRFVLMTPQPDCSIVGDCGASYLPKLDVQTYNAYPGTGPNPNTLLIHNVGGSVMQWSITAIYPSGTPAGWLIVSPSQGTNNATARIGAADNLPPGTYRATLVIDGGPLAGSQTIPVTYTAAAPPPVAPVITINSVVNAASFAAVPVVPGSLVSIMGSAFTGKAVAVTFDGKAGSILFSNDSQINVMVPADLASGTSKVTVTVDGVSSAPRNVDVAQFAPAIFKGAVLNQDWTFNSVSNAAEAGSIIQIYATGLSGKGAITGRIGDRVIALPYYAGPAPGFPGVQQIDLQVPSDLPAMTMDVSVCGTTADKPDAPVCSIAAPLTLK